MRLWDVGFVAARIIAIFFAARAAVELTSQAGFWWNDGTTRWLILIGWTVALAVAGLLWRWSKGVADRIAFDADEQRPEDLPRESESLPRTSVLAAVAFAVAGIVIGLQGVIDVFRSLSMLIVNQAMVPSELFELDRSFFFRQDVIGIVASLAKAAIGFALFRYRDTLAAALDAKRPEPAEG